jgi:hypothetical protein
MPDFEIYRNLNGNSGVTAYAIAPDAIHVRFVDDRHTYVYNYVQPGRRDVERMKTLARTGRGLSAYISRNVKTRYAVKT